jgi:TonB family protein
MLTSPLGLRPPSQIRWMKLLMSSVVAVLWVNSAEAADDAWVEMRSAHFQLISNASEGNTRTLTWQLEQIRNVIAALWPWARVDLSTPLGVIAVKDESSMRALAPAYWERNGDVRPVSVWVTGADRPYLVIRADVRGDDRNTLNPHISAYYSYVSLVLQSSMARDLPQWLGRGLAGVLSNTVVRDTFILLGPPIPWHLQRMRSGSRLSLKELVAVTRSSPQFTEGDRLLAFDAQSWAFVHYLMFGKEGRQRRQLDQLIALINQGTDPAIALKEALGPVDAFEGPLNVYVNQTLFPYAHAALDVSVKREAFNIRALSASEAAAARAAFHVAMRRPLEARALISAARQADPSAAASYVAEGLLLDSEGNREDARTAYANAVERSSTNPHAYSRLASLESRPNPDRDTLLKIEKHLTRAVELNDRLAAAYAYLAEVRAALDSKSDGALPLARRAIALEPAEPGHHLAAARVLWRKGNYDDARKEAQTALSLSRRDQERDGAQQVMRGIDAASAHAAEPKAAANDASARREGATTQQSGSGQFGPEIQFDTKGVEFGPWIRQFVAQVKRNWFIPQAISMTGQVVLTFNVHRDGTITDVEVRSPSAIDAFNNAAKAAIIASNLTAPLPPEYPSEKAFFTVTFYYNEVPPPR